MSASAYTLYIANSKYKFVPVHARKTHKGSRGIILITLNLDEEMRA